MKQTFKVIPIEDYGVVVDDIDNCKAGDKILSPYNLIQTFVKFHAGTGTRNMCWVEVKETKTLQQITNSEKVIATIGKRLEGVPLIELADEVGKIASEWADDEKEYGAFFAGYKANQNKYSEEDMRRAILKAHKLGAKGWEHSEKNVDEILQSLHKNRIPVSVELEMEQYTSDELVSVVNDEVHPVYQTKWRIKINTETNTITPLKVSYG